MRIPLAISRQMELVYRNVLAASHPQVQDDCSFHEAKAAAQARWHLFQVLHRLPSCLIQDASRVAQQPGANNCWRGWIALSRITERSNSMLALGTVAYALVGRLRQQWSLDVHVLPYYPAFQREAG